MNAKQWYQRRYMGAPMASLSPALSPCTVQPKRSIALPSVLEPRTLPPIRCLGSSPVLAGRNGTIRLSPRQGRVVASAVSGSPGTERKSKEQSAYPIDDLEVFDLNGKAIPITDLWKDRTAVVAFARHFGCVLCRRRADFLVAKKDVMDEAGVALVLIGPGSVDQARTFYEQTKFQGEVYADPSYKSYQALQFASGVTTTFTPKAALQIIQSYREGYRQDWKLSFEKDTRTRGGWQQGGIIVAGPGKDNIFYMFRDKEAGDEPEIEDVLRACCSEKKK